MTYGKIRGSNMPDTPLIACQNPPFLDLFGACKPQRPDCRCHVQFAFQSLALV